MKESSVDRSVCNFARERGCIVVKLTTFGNMGTAGLPDRLVLMPGGRAFFIEMKSTDGKCTPLQLRKQAELRALGFHVYVCNDTMDGAMIVATELNGRTSERAGALDAQEYARVVDAVLPKRQRRVRRG
jgi:Holliday junction resolvase